METNDRVIETGKKIVKSPSGPCHEIALPEVVLWLCPFSFRPRIDNPVLLLKAIETCSTIITTVRIDLAKGGQGLEMDLVSRCLIELYGLGQSWLVGNKLPRPALAPEFPLSRGQSSVLIHGSEPIIRGRYGRLDQSVSTRKVLSLPWWPYFLTMAVPQLGHCCW